MQGLSPALAGLLLIAQPVVMVALSLLAGRLSDRVEPRLVVAVGMGLTAVGLFALTTLSFSTPLWFVVGVLVVLGVGFGCFASPNTNAVMSAVESRFYGVAAGILGTMRLTGQMVGMGATMTTFGLYLGQQPIGPGEPAGVPRRPPYGLPAVRGALVRRRGSIPRTRQPARRRAPIRARTHGMI